MPSETGLPEIISETQRLIKFSHEANYKEFVDKFNAQLEVLRKEFEKFPKLDNNILEDACTEIENILSDFDEMYVAPMNPPNGVKPFTYIKNLLPSLKIYIRN